MSRLTSFFRTSIAASSLPLVLLAPARASLLKVQMDTALPLVLCVAFCTVHKLPAHSVSCGIKLAASYWNARGLGCMSTTCPRGPSSRAIDDIATGEPRGREEGLRRGEESCGRHSADLLRLGGEHLRLGHATSLRVDYQALSKQQA